MPAAIRIYPAPAAAALALMQMPIGHFRVNVRSYMQIQSQPLPVNSVWRLDPISTSK